MRKSILWSLVLWTSVACTNNDTDIPQVDVVTPGEDDASDSPDADPNDVDSEVNEETDPPTETDPPLVNETDTPPVEETNAAADTAADSAEDSGQTSAPDSAHHADTDTAIHSGVDSAADTAADRPSNGPSGDSDSGRRDTASADTSVDSAALPPTDTDGTDTDTSTDTDTDTSTETSTDTDTGGPAPSPDADGDGSTLADGDCDDNDPGRYPSATETCDGVDEDCDGLVDVQGVDAQVAPITWQGAGDTQPDLAAAGITLLSTAAPSSSASATPMGLVLADAPVRVSAVFDLGSDPASEAEGVALYQLDLQLVGTSRHAGSGASGGVQGLPGFGVVYDRSQQQLHAVVDGDTANPVGSAVVPAGTSHSFSMTLAYTAPALRAWIDGVLVLDTVLPLGVSAEGAPTVAASTGALAAPVLVTDLVAVNVIGGDADLDGTCNALDIETCDGFDNDGDGELNEGSPDADGDGIADCIDIELCNGDDDNGDGFVDNDAADAPTWYLDADGDGLAGTTTTQACAAPTSAWKAESTDCDDADPSVLEDRTWFEDADGDGFGSASSTTASCPAPVGFVADDSDCDDTRADSYPGASEFCDIFDHDCDGSTTANAIDQFVVYQDLDADGAGTNTVPTSTACAVPDGYSATGNDCDPFDPSKTPGAPEACDGRDNDCDGAVDEGTVCGVTIASREGKSYLFYDDLSDKTDPLSAHAICETTGRHLATVSSADENTWLRTQIDSGSGAGHSFWLGLTDSALEGTWSWLDGSAFLYDNWAPGEPNNGSGIEHWLEFKGSADWNDRSDASDLRFVCESGAPRNVYLDADNDGWGDHDTTVWSSDVPPGYSATGGDCDDADDTVFPGDGGACELPQSCLDLLALGHTDSGTYTVEIGGVPTPVYCDQVNLGGGWMKLLQDDGEATAPYADTTAKDCGDDTWRGPYADSGASQFATLGFATLMPHTQIRLSADLALVKTPDSQEGVRVRVDNDLLFSADRPDPAFTYQTNLCGTDHGYTTSLMDLVVPHTAATASVRFEHTLDQAVTDEYLLVDDVDLWIR